MEIAVVVLAIVALAAFAGWLWAQRQATDARSEAETLRGRLAEAQLDLARVEADAQARQDELVRAREDLELRFKGMASDVLAKNSEEFQKRATEQFKQQSELAGKELEARRTAVEQLVKPMRERLEELRKYVDASDKARVRDYTQVKQGVDLLVAETSGLRQILHNPQMRGQWGEQHLLNVLKASGMTEHVDYIEQDQIDGGRLRPDVVVNVPGGASVIIDAKTPHDSYDRALRSGDENEQRRLLIEHARALHSRAGELGARDYSQFVEGSPDFVVMYVPTEPMLDAAIEVDEQIWTEAWGRHRVLITTPGLLIALLRTVALAWQQQNVQQNAQQIAEEATELYRRLATYTEHVDKVGRGLRQAVNAYNDSVGSLQSRVLVQARKMEELDAGVDAATLGEPGRLDVDVRQLSAPEGD